MYVCGCFEVIWCKAHSSINVSHMEYCTACKGLQFFNSHIALSSTCLSPRPIDVNRVSWPTPSYIDLIKSHRNPALASICRYALPSFFLTCKNLGSWSRLLLFPLGFEFDSILASWKAIYGRGTCVCTWARFLGGFVGLEDKLGGGMWHFVVRRYDQGELEFIGLCVLNKVLALGVGEFICGIWWWFEDYDWCDGCNVTSLEVLVFGVTSLLGLDTDCGLWKRWVFCICIMLLWLGWQPNTFFLWQLSIWILFPWYDVKIYTSAKKSRVLWSPCQVVSSCEMCRGGFVHGRFLVYIVEFTPS